MVFFEQGGKIAFQKIGFVENQIIHPPKFFRCNIDKPFVFFDGDNTLGMGSELGRQDPQARPDFQNIFIGIDIKGINQFVDQIGIGQKILPQFFIGTDFVFFQQSAYRDIPHWDNSLYATALRERGEYFLFSR